MLLTKPNRKLTTMKKPQITAKYFTEKVGNSPENDDLERVNCPQAGELGHFFCGWNEEKDLPRFMTEPLINPTKQPTR